MEVVVTGLVGKREKKAVLTEAAKFFAEQLMHPRMVRNLTIDIEVDRSLDVEGQCVNEDGTRNPRWFTIGIRYNDDLNEMIKTLAHEMVHVKQHAKNELRSGYMIASRGGMKMVSKWMGEIWTAKGKEDPYFDAPWEIEAYGREVGLFHRFIEKTRVSSSK